MPSTSTGFVPVIASAGLVSSLGATLDSTWTALLAGEFIAGHSAARLAPADETSRPRVIELASRAAGEALAGFDPCRSGCEPHEIAVIVGTSKGPAGQWLSDRTGRPGRVELTGLADVAASVGGELNFTGPRLTLSAACASALHALIRGALMIRSGEVKAALVIGAEASLQEIFIASFGRLGLLPDPSIGCRPMDRTRDGLLTSEAAAAVVLARSDAPEIRRLSRPVAIDGFAFGAEAHHLTNVDPHGATLRRVIDQYLGAGGVDLVHAHATGTRANDAVELAAIDAAMRARDSRGTLVYSHKGALGHSLGASGLVSTALAFRSHHIDIVPGNVRTLDPVPTQTVTVSRHPVKTPIRRSLILAAGFGGPVGAVVLQNCSQG